MNSIYRGDVLTHHGLGVNSSGTDISLFSGKDYDWIYVNAPAYQSIHTFKISGQGNFELIQRYTVEDMSADLVPTKGFSVSCLQTVMTDSGDKVTGSGSLLQAAMISDVGIW